MDKQKVSKKNKPERNLEMEKFEMDRAKWKTRRLMSWCALVSIFVVTALAFFAVSESRLEKLSEVITWFYITTGSIVGAYFGFTTWASRK